MFKNFSLIKYKYIYIIFIYMYLNKNNANELRYKNIIITNLLNDIQKSIIRIFSTNNL